MTDHFERGTCPRGHEMVIPRGGWVGCPVCSAASGALDRIRALVDGSTNQEITDSLTANESPTDVLNWLASDELRPGTEPWNIAMDALGKDKDAALEAWCD